MFSTWDDPGLNVLSSLIGGTWGILNTCSFGELVFLRFFGGAIVRSNWAFKKCRCLALKCCWVLRSVEIGVEFLGSSALTNWFANISVWLRELMVALVLMLLKIFSSACFWIKTCCWFLPWLSLSLWEMSSLFIRAVCLLFVAEYCKFDADALPRFFI